MSKNVDPVAELQAEAEQPVNRNSAFYEGVRYALGKVAAHTAQAVAEHEEKSNKWWGDRIEVKEAEIAQQAEEIKRLRGLRGIPE